jgi:hypothetical protein
VAFMNSLCLHMILVKFLKIFHLKKNIHIDFHGAELFSEAPGWSRNLLSFIEPEVLLPCSQELAPGCSPATWLQSTASHRIFLILLSLFRWHS